MIDDNPATNAPVDRIRLAMPFLSAMLDDLYPIVLPRPRSLSVPEAVVKIVVAQMLSGAAARTIYERLSAARNRTGLAGSWMLPEKKLLSCGLSARKARAIREFAAAYHENMARIESWPRLGHGELVREVSSFWGLSSWTADMLAIFHFGHEDVFPMTDGSIKRALDEAGKTFGVSKSAVAVNAVSPFRTHLALYLWKSLDTNYWKRLGRSLNLPEYDVSLGWLIMRPFFLPRQAPYFHLREPSRSSWG